VEVKETKVIYRMELERPVVMSNVKPIFLPSENGGLSEAQRD
jgi:hypothetical protein